MRCHEARQRIVALRGELSPEKSDRELREHLRTCPECAAFAQAERAITRDFAAAGADDNEGDLPLSMLKTRAEARAGLAPSEPSRETNLMSTIFNQMKKRPRLGLSISIAVVLLAVATLVPFKFQDTIGYDVAIAGVNKDLAMDSERIQELLTALGIEDVAIDVSGCEVTCDLKLSDLKSEYDVQMVIAAFDELGNCELTEITPDLETAHVSLIKLVHNSLFDDGDVDADATHKIVADRIMALGDESTGTFTIWVDKDSCTTIDGDWTVMTSEVDFLESLDETLPAIEGSTQIQVRKLTDGTSEMTVTTADGETHVIDLDAEDAAEQLEALGLDAQILSGGTGGDGHVAMFIAQGNCDGADDDEVDDGDGAAKTAEETELPEGYTLAQNYPNPFNPTTQISYSVPAACHVLLEIYNIQGQKVRTLVDQQISAGDHTVEWNATADDGKTVATGAYFYRLTAGETVQSKKMMFMK